MAWVYILRGGCGRHYIGSTTDMQRRLEEHNRGHTHTTKRLKQPLELLVSLELPTLDEARQLERELKAKKNPKLAIYRLEQLKGR